MDELILLLEKHGLYDDQLQAEYDFMESLNFEESMVCSFLEDVSAIINNAEIDDASADKIFSCISKIRSEL